MRLNAILVFTVALMICWVAVGLTDVPNERVNTGIESSLDTEWGPDGFGYFALDQNSNGAPYNWIDITATGTEIFAGINLDQGWSPWIQLPFTFPFYSWNYDSVTISANMIIKFTSSYVHYSHAVPNNGEASRIDPWVQDMYHVADSSRYYYQAFGDSMFVVSFHDARYYNYSYRHDPSYGKTLQVTLWSDGRIKFQYNSLQNTVAGTPHNSGIDDDFGEYGLSCGSSFSDGDAIGFYPPVVGPNPVDDLVIGLVESDTEMRSAVLNWGEVAGAAQYKIYRSYEGPNTGFALVDSTTQTQWIDTDAVVNLVRSFYYVTTDDGM